MKKAEFPSSRQSVDRILGNVYGEQRGCTGPERKALLGYTAGCNSSNRHTPAVLTRINLTQLALGEETEQRRALKNILKKLEGHLHEITIEAPGNYNRSGVFTKITMGRRFVLIYKEGEGPPDWAGLVIYGDTSCGNYGEFQLDQIDEIHKFLTDASQSPAIYQEKTREIETTLSEVEYELTWGIDGDYLDFPTFSVGDREATFFFHTGSADTNKERPNYHSTTIENGIQYLLGS